MGNTTQLKICYWPGRERSYVRTRVLLKGLRQAGCEVLDCSSSDSSWKRYFHGFGKFLKYKKQADVIFVGFMGQGHIFPVALLTRKPIIFDAFLSVYQTLAFDRKSIKAKGLIANLIRWAEKHSCLRANAVFLDTQEHIKYFAREYDLAPQIFQRSLLGCDESIMVSNEQPDPNRFLVHFHGEFQALHGTEFIIEAARQVPHIQFQMVGAGRLWEQTKAVAKRLKMTNVEFVPPVKFDQIPNYIARADICLGLLGSTEKTRLVIPFKVYEQVAMGKPVITADTPAIREIFTHKENIYLCRAGDPDSLAQAISELHDNRELRQHIAENGRKVFMEQCTPAKIGAAIKETALGLVK